MCMCIFPRPAICHLCGPVGRDGCMRIFTAEGGTFVRSKGYELSFVRSCRQGCVYFSLTGDLPFMRSCRQG